MNHVRFMFNRIKDYTLLYEEISIPSDQLFGVPYTEEIDHIKDYCKRIIDEVVPKLHPVTTVNYLGCLERIANEVYSLEITGGKYKVSLTVDTFHKKNARLTVDIEPEYSQEDMTNKFDVYLEKLKIELKNHIVSDWNSCTWLIDEQSEQMGAELYPEFFRLENEIRAFASRVLTYKVGVNWLSSYGLEKFNESAKSLAATFQQRVPEFDNVNADLISLTLESLFEIIFKCTIYNEETVLTPADFKKLDGIIKSGKAENIRQFLEKKKTAQYKIWEDIFVSYFDDPERFKNVATKFINSRNHIAHNKLISWNAYNIILKELDAIQEDLDSATEKFEEDALSKEVEYTRDVLAEQEMNEYDDREYWRSRVADETGIDVLDEDEIYEKFTETLMELHANLLKHFQYDLCVTIGDLDDAGTDGEYTVFTCVCNANDDYFVEIRVSMIIDDDMGEESYLHIYCYKDNEKLHEATITYVNGAGSEDDEFRMQVDCDSEYNDYELEEFTQEIIDVIENDLNPYIDEINAVAYESKGSESVVADFPCENCGKYGVSIREDFYPMGSCCYCGVENDIHVCSLCGVVFNEYGGEGDVCNGCLVEDDED